MQEETETKNERYHEIKEAGLAENESIRASVTHQNSPGKGIVIHLLNDYVNLSRPKSTADLKHHAVGLSAIVPETAKPFYDKIAKEAIRKHGRSREAEFQTAMVMLKHSQATCLYKDESVLNQNHIQKSFEASKSEGVLDAVEKMEAVDPSSLQDEALSKLAESVMSEVNFKTTKQEKTMDEGWRQHFESKKKEKGSETPEP